MQWHYDAMMKRAGQTGAQIIRFASTDEHASVIWTEIKPKLSKVENTFWVPMLDEFPFVLVDPVPGSHFHITPRCEAYACGASTGVIEFDRWLYRHQALLSRLLAGEVDQHQFYIALEARLDEMENVLAP